MKRVAKVMLTVAGVAGTAAVGAAAPPFDAQRHQTMDGHSTPTPQAVQNAVGPWGQPVMATPNVVHSPAPYGMPVENMNYHHPQVMSWETPVNGGLVQAGHTAPTEFAGQPLVPAYMPVGGPPQHPAQAEAFSSQRSQLRFVGPKGARIGWYVSTPAPGPNGRPVMLAQQLELPGRYNFLQASIYRLKLSGIPGRPGLELYPTIEVVPSNAKTTAFLSHNYIPVEFTEEDFDQVTAGNYLTKVIYLPDAQFQSPTGAGPEELVSTRLEPGVDPIAEAHRRGHILLVIRVGGIDLEATNSPPVDTTGSFGSNQNMNTIVSPNTYAPPQYVQPQMAPNMTTQPMPYQVPVSNVAPASTYQAPNTHVQQAGGNYNWNNVQAPNQMNQMHMNPVHQQPAQPFYIQNSKGEMVIVDMANQPPTYMDNVPKTMSVPYDEANGNPGVLPVTMPKRDLKPKKPETNQRRSGLLNNISSKFRR